VVCVKVRITRKLLVIAKNIFAKAYSELWLQNCIEILT
jgi:hypothetical protein